MGPFDEILAKVERIPEFIEDSLQKIIESDKFEDKVTAKVSAQMKNGKRGDGTNIDPPYTSKTVAIKKKKGQRSDVVTLDDYGDFQAGLRIKKYKGRGEIVSIDKKSEKLQEKYKPEILDISDENLNEIIEDDVKPELLIDIKEYLK